ncbi:MAG: hypothetical protein G01um101438_351 [Parcubacteria group bacterium Gr01-1014_38]|nr:MAG: hypothetical protein G01um101438_351 [Parcubacteria group bacterium Gr01-1014_38]
MRVGALLAILLILLVGAFGMWHALSMNGEMSGCPLMMTASLCGMSPTEHTALWQKLFTAVPHRGTLALSFVFSAPGVALFRLRDLRVHAWIIRARYQAYRLLALAFAPLEPLKRAFSQGILHPKICG